MFGRGLTRLQPAYVEDVAEAIGRTMQRAETPSTIFEFGGSSLLSFAGCTKKTVREHGYDPAVAPSW
jgi:NADH dehydrogenase